MRVRVAGRAGPLLLLLWAATGGVFAAPPETSTRGAPVLIEHSLGEVPPDDPRMEAYSHGNYLLILAESLGSIAVLALIVFTGWGGRMQERIDGVVREPNLRVAMYSVWFTLALFLAGFPLAFYASFAREKNYGFSHQTLAAWLGERGKTLLIAALLQAVFCVILYAAIRRFGRRWWVAGSLLAVLAAILVIAVAPVLIAPLFNTFTPLKDTALRTEILEMARREGIPAGEVYQVDASRQSGHNNAYVAGLLGSQRIVLYDTLLSGFAPREIRAVMGHEMGHYVLNHVWRTVAFLGLLIVAAFFAVDLLARRIIARRPGLGIRSLAAPSSLPLISLILSVCALAAGPAIATFSRAQESRADRFALEMTGDPEAAASVFLKFGRYDLGEYHVHPWIETLLYSHPSLAERVRAAQDYARRHGTVPRTP